MFPICCWPTSILTTDDEVPQVVTIITGWMDGLNISVCLSPFSFHSASIVFVSRSFYAKLNFRKLCSRSNLFNSSMWLQIMLFFYQSNQQQPPLPSNWEKDWTTSSSKSWTTMLPAACFSVLHPLFLVVLCYLCVFWSLIDFLIVSLIWINKQDEPADWGSVLQRTFWVGSLLCCSLKGGKRLPSDGHAHHQVVIKES